MTNSNTFFTLFRMVSRRAKQSHRNTHLVPVRIAFISFICLCFLSFLSYFSQSSCKWLLFLLSFLVLHFRSIWLLQFSILVLSVSHSVSSFTPAIFLSLCYPFFLLVFLYCLSRDRLPFSLFSSSILFRFRFSIAPQSSFFLCCPLMYIYCLAQSIFFSPFLFIFSCVRVFRRLRC